MLVPCTCLGLVLATWVKSTDVPTLLKCKSWKLDHIYCSLNQPGDMAGEVSFYNQCQFEPQVSLQSLKGFFPGYIPAQYETLYA